MLDFHLLKEWATNPDVCLMPQDEELFLADKMYVEVMLQILDMIPILDHKRNLLIDALCIIVYDNTTNDNSQRDEELKNRVISELNKRQDKLRLADYWTMDYIKEVVYPQLDFGKQNVKKAGFAEIWGGGIYVELITFINQQTQSEGAVFANTHTDSNTHFVICKIKADSLIQFKPTEFYMQKVRLGQFFRFIPLLSQSSHPIPV